MYVFVLIVLLHYNVEYIAAYTRCLYSSSSLDVKSRWTLFGKENKKKKKSKKSEGITSSSSSSSPIATPMRVDTNINIPVRQQIAWAKAYKRMQTDVNKSYVTKKFRQEKGEKETAEEYVEIDYKNTPPPAVIVDGYNIIGYINSVEGRNIDFSDARDCLISDLCVLKGATGWHIEVVFDAYKTGGPEKVESIDNVEVVYTSKEETADNYIERRFGELRQNAYTNMVVATDDKVLQMVAGSIGSGFISAAILLEELRIAYRGWEDVSVELKAEVDRRRPTLGDGISNELKNAIEMLKTENALKKKENMQR